MSVFFFSKNFTLRTVSFMTLFIFLALIRGKNEVPFLLWVMIDLRMLFPRLAVEYKANNLIIKIAFFVKSGIVTSMY